MIRMMATVAACFWTMLGAVAVNQDRFEIAGCYALTALVFAVLANAWREES